MRKKILPYVSLRKILSAATSVFNTVKYFIRLLRKLIVAHTVIIFFDNGNCNDCRQIWTWYSPADLIIPMDVHVIQESIKLGLLPPKSTGTLKNAVLLTNALKQIWSDAPCKGDFALFGIGID